MSIQTSLDKLPDLRDCWLYMHRHEEHGWEVGYEYASEDCQKEVDKFFSDPSLEVALEKLVNYIEAGELKNELV